MLSQRLQIVRPIRRQTPTLGETGEFKNRCRRQGKPRSQQRLRTLMSCLQPDEGVGVEQNHLGSGAKVRLPSPCSTQDQSPLSTAASATNNGAAGGCTNVGGTSESRHVSPRRSTNTSRPASALSRRSAKCFLASVAETAGIWTTYVHRDQPPTSARSIPKPRQPTPPG